MILTYFKPLLERRPNTVGSTLSHIAYPLDSRLPERLVRLLEKLG